MVKRSSQSGRKPRSVMLYSEIHEMKPGSRKKKERLDSDILRRRFFLAIGTIALAALGLCSVFMETF